MEKMESSELLRDVYNGPIFIDGRIVKKVQK